MLDRPFAIVWLLLGAVLAATNAKAQVDSGNRATASCVARELWRRALLVEDERELYLEPVVFAVSGNRALIAGKPSYVFAKRQRDAIAELQGRHTVFGAVIDADGTSRTVPPPPVNYGRVTALAGRGLQTGGWAVIFAEVDSFPATPDEATEYWYGEYDNGQWTALERLPRPDGVSVLSYNNSRLVQNGDTVAWATLARVPGQTQGAVLFERKRGAWTHIFPATAYASGVELVHTPNHGFVLIVLNRTQVNGIGISSLFFYPRSSNWQLRRMVELGEDPTIVGGEVHFSGEIGIASWFRRADSTASRLELRAMTGAILTQNEPILSVDTNAAPEFAPVVGLGDAAWVTHHLHDARNSAPSSELRLVRQSGNGPEVLWRASHPYLGPFEAAHSGQDVLIVGPQLDKEHELLVSLLIRLRIECGGAAPPTE